MRAGVPEQKFRTYKGHPCVVLWRGRDYAIIRVEGQTRPTTIQQRQIAKFLR